MFGQNLCIGFNRDLIRNILIKRETKPAYIVLTCALSGSFKTINACVGAWSDPIQGPENPVGHQTKPDVYIS